MAKFLKVLIVSFLLSCGATAQAQCLPMQGDGPPRIFDPLRGCYVPQGMVLPQTNYGVYGQQQVMVPQYNYFGGVQQVMVPQYGYSNGVPMYGMGAPMAAGITQCQALGGIVGGVLGSFARNYQAQAIILGAVGGGIVGNALCYNSQGQRVVVVPQQQVVGEYGGQTGPGMQVPGVSVPPQQVSAMPQNHCAHDPGTAPGILNIPGHPMDGKTVCAKPGDTNISRWL